MSEQRIGKHTIVSFTFSVLDADGSTLEESDMPMDYLHGAPHAQMFPKVEAALEGRQVGEQVQVTLTPSEAFGDHDASLIFTEVVDNVPAEYRYVGARPVFHNDLGEKMVFVVTGIQDGKVTMDGNHPYAGKTLTFQIRVEGIRAATADEISASQLQAPGSDTLQ